MIPSSYNFIQIYFWFRFLFPRGGKCPCLRADIHQSILKNIFCICVCVCIYVSINILAVRDVCILYYTLTSKKFIKRDDNSRRTIDLDARHWRIVWAMNRRTIKVKKGRTADDGSDKFMAIIYILNRKYSRTIGSGEISERRWRCHTPWWAAKIESHPISK